MDLLQQQANLDIIEKPTNRDVIMEQVKSRAVVKYSAVHNPTDFARLQCNTNLNLPPSNWLTSYAESYGLHHTLANSSGFSSFRMAHMFPDCITEVDVVSDAENIKKLLKIPYSRNAVSMMVHCIEKTLLIDEFDIHKHLLRTSESDWEWLRKFFFDHVLHTLSEKRLGATAKDKSRHTLQERALVSKFLHYSLTEPEGDEAPSEQSTDSNEETLTKMWPPLPEPKPEEQLPDPSTDQTFNRNVVWTFEDLQMLLGTNMPIFGGTTHPCISLRLRDANKPISVLTGIDYWLDNLMCNVPEVVMCYHLDGIVQRYELVKTEDLPHLDNSKFSPNLIRGVAQNILSFLKSNATKAGHTYWLFKGKDEDVVKLYDLTSLCSESQVDQGQNPFTVPVAMLLYRVARNMKHSSEPTSLRPGTIRALLNNCLDLLPKEKYPQIVTSAHYMLSDLYLPLGISPECLQQDDSKSPEPPDHNTSLINSFSISDDLDPPPLPPYEPPPPIVGSVTERCRQALEHVVAGLQCLQFFKITSPSKDPKTEKDDENCRRDDQQEPKMAHSHQPIPMHYSSLTPDKSKDEKPEDVEVAPTINNKKKNKKKKASLKNAEKLNKDNQIEESLNDRNQNDVSCLEQYPVYFWNSDKTALLHKKKSVPLPTWQVPNPTDTASWKDHLKTLLYEKACLVYNTLAEDDHAAKRYGESLRCVGLVLRSHAHMAAGCGRCTSLVSVVLTLAGDNCFHLAQNFENIDIHRIDFTSYDDTDLALLAEMEQDMPGGTYPYECVIMPDALESVEQLMLSSLTCYQQALLLRPSDALHSRIGNVHNELSTLYMNKINAINTKDLNQAVVRTKITTLLKLCEHHLELGKAEFVRLNDKYNTALLLTNSGRLMRMKAVYLGFLDTGLQNIQRSYYDSALDLYDKALDLLGNRKAGPQIWDVIRWEKSGTLYNMATIYQDYPPGISEKSEDESERELIDLFTRTLQSCDFETPGPRQLMYQFRAAMLHFRLASLYHAMYRKKQMDDAKRKHILHLANLHFEKSANLMEHLEHPVEFLRLQLERVALQELIAENSGLTGKLKALQTALVYLKKCSPVLDSVAVRHTTNQSESSNDNEKAVDSEEKDKEETLLTLYQSRVQFVLKSLVKVTLSSQNPKMSTMAKKYKEMYSMILKQEPGVSLPIHLKNVAAILNMFSLS